MEPLDKKEDCIYNCETCGGEVVINRGDAAPECCGETMAEKAGE